MARESKIELGKINIVFKLLFLKYIGVQPRINFCYECGKKHKTLQKQYFNVQEGGLICSSCVREKDRSFDNLNQNQVDLIKRVYRTGIDSLDGLNVDESLLNSIDELIDKFILYHLDFKLKSEDFLKIIKGFDKN